MREEKLVRQKHHQMADMNNPSHENLHLNHFLFNFSSIVSSSSMPLSIRVVKHLLFWNRFSLKPVRRQVNGWGINSVI